MRKLSSLLFVYTWWSLAVPAQAAEKSIPISINSVKSTARATATGVYRVIQRNTEFDSCLTIESIELQTSKIEASSQFCPEGDLSYDLVDFEAGKDLLKVHYTADIFGSYECKIKLSQKKIFKAKCHYKKK